MKNPTRRKPETKRKVPPRGTGMGSVPQTGDCPMNNPHQQPSSPGDTSQGDGPQSTGDTARHGKTLAEGKRSETSESPDRSRLLDPDVRVCQPGATWGPYRLGCDGMWRLMTHPPHCGMPPGTDCLWPRCLCFPANAGSDSR